jgi:hypothetical protein
MNMHTMEFIRVINIGIILFIGMWTIEFIGIRAIGIIMVMVVIKGY